MSNTPTPNDQRPTADGGERGGLRTGYYRHHTFTCKAAAVCRQCDAELGDLGANINEP
jgi:hypothetical protein